MARAFHGSFVGGEMSPHMFGRIGDLRVQTGLATCRNFVSSPQGPAHKRPGTRFVRRVKDAAKKTRVIPFVYSDEQSLVVEIGEGYFRFATNGQSLLYATPKVVSGVNATTDVISFASAHGLASNTAVLFSVEGGSMPTGLSAYTTYYVIPDTATTLKVSASSGPGAAVDIGALASGATLRLFTVSDAPAAFVSSRNVSAINLLTSVVSFAAAHGLTTGNPIVLTSPTSLVTTPLVQTETVNGAVVYYAIVASPTTIKIASSLANALAGTAIDLDGDPVTFVDAGDLIQRTTHGLVNDEVVSFVTTGVGLTDGVNYYVVNAGLNDFQVSATLGGAPVAITNGTGYVTRVDTRVHRSYSAGDVVTWPGVGGGFYYCAHPTKIVTFNTSTDKVLLTGHSLANGTLVRFFTGGTLPSGLAELSVYFVVNAGTDDFQVSPYSNGAAINLTTEAEGLSYCEVVEVMESLPASADLVWRRMPDDGTLEVPNDYSEADLFAITYDQSNDVVSLAVETVMEAELRRLGPTQWVWAPISFSPALPAPVSVTVTPTLSPPISINAILVATPAQLETAGSHELLTGDTLDIRGVAGITGIPDGQYGADRVDSTHLKLRNKTTGALIATSGAPYTANTGKIRRVSPLSEQTHSYRVTAVTAEGVESDPSSVAAETTNNLTADGSYNTVTWAAVPGAAKYRVYRLLLGQYGQIGETETTSFRDENEDPDLDRTPPFRDRSLRHHTPFSSAVGHFEQSRVFGRRQTVYFTNAGTESELSYNIPVRDDNRISRTLFVRQYAAIRHVVPLDQLLLLTGGIEIRLSPRDSDVITPTSIASRSQTYVGANQVQPAIINSTVVFAAARGGHVREMGFQFSSQSYVTGDLSIRAAHLFDGLTIKDMAHQKAPMPIVWCVSSSGKLLGFTYAPEESIGAWHKHDTDGVFESVCVVPEGDVDVIYAIVKRTVGGSTVRFLERFAEASSDATNGFFMDCGVTLTTSAAVTTVSGLGHLEGKTVVVVANGTVQTSRVVTNGSITLATPLAAGNNVVHVGLSFTSELQTIPFATQIEGYATDRTKNVDAVWLRVLDASQFLVGPTPTALRPAIRSVNGLFSGLLPVGVDGTWSLDGQVVVQHTTPLPLTVVSMTTNVSLGG